MLIRIHLLFLLEEKKKRKALSLKENFSTVFNIMYIFYDGHCPLCFHTMKNYKRKFKGNTIVKFIDIRHHQFKPENFNLNPAKIEKGIYVSIDGTLFHGPMALLKIWEFLGEYFNRYRILCIIVELPGLKILFRFIYFTFAKYRKIFPKNKNLCQDDICFKE